MTKSKDGEKSPVENRQTESQEEFNKRDIYSLDESISWIKKLKKAKFDESIEIHLRLGIDPQKSDQLIRSTFTLPHGTGKTKKIAAFVLPDKEKEAKAAGADIVGGEDLINDIKKTGKTDFEVAVAQSEIMPKLSMIAKVLGQKGLMPNPKTSTVSPDVKKMITELKAGKESFKNDETGNIHLVVGKVSFPDEKIKENITSFLDAINKAKPSSLKSALIKSITICTSMGPGIKVKI